MYGTYIGFIVRNKFIAYCALRNLNISKIGILQLNNANIHNEIATTCQLLKDKLIDSNVYTGIESKINRIEHDQKAIDRCRIATILECQINQTFNTQPRLIDFIKVRKSVSNFYKVKILTREDLNTFVSKNIPSFPKLEDGEFNLGMSDAWAISFHLNDQHRKQELMNDPKTIEKLNFKLENDRIISTIKKSITLQTDENVIENLNRIIESRREKLLNKWIT